MTDPKLENTTMEVYKRSRDIFKDITEDERKKKDLPKLTVKDFFDSWVKAEKKRRKL